MELKAGETTFLDIALADSSVDLLGEGEEVVVKAKTIERKRPERSKVLIKRGVIDLKKEYQQAKDQS